MSLHFQGEEPTESRSLPINFGILFLRFAAICSLVYYELALHLEKAWRSIWREETWGLIDQFENRGIPLPNAVSVAIILAAFLTGLGVLLGFLARVNAVILTVILAFLLLAQVQTSPNLTPEAVVLYIGILLTLTITGPGRFSMDHMLTAQRGRRSA